MLFDFIGVHGSHIRCRNPRRSLLLTFCHRLHTHTQLPYTLSIEYDTHQGALQPPQLNIPSSGVVPDRVETFSVHLPCTGNVSAEVPVSINLHVRAPPRRNDTRLNFKRNKICLKGTYDIII